MDRGAKNNMENLFLSSNFSVLEEIIKKLVNIK